ncbi:IS110 family transposase [Streptomyces mirabilis]|uniref:Transposase IS116/IS110/IS902 family protein n=1 Tax=Streptomyces mirabilis TaxID=68239 RepID=A0A1I2N7R4_9ACTN|nr:IS110 family transposase [Streptomyces mirabilis]SFF97431.1 Transposase IS116/IS110/IS902 family protein [Streptomyces mirabilis]
MTRLFCGIDWAESHHDIALVDHGGDQVAKLRISDDYPGLCALLELLARHGDSPDAPIPVAIETPRGLLVAALRATGRKVYAINPLAAARYRDRGSVSRAKSDAADARILANILRTDIKAHRPLPADSELGQAVAVLARAHQDAIWDKGQLVNRLRSHLREYFPAALLAFHGSGKLGLDSAYARAILTSAPTPAAAAKLTRGQLRALLNRAGRLRRSVDEEVERLRELFRSEQMRQLPLVEKAMGNQTTALLRQLDAACTSSDVPSNATEEAFLSHPDAQIITSMPGLSVMSGARVLAEIGDDPTRFADARAVKAYAGAAPVTRASGRSHIVVARTVKNRRLAAVGYMWAFAALRSSEPRAHYDRRRDGGERHTPALRNLFNKLLGCLYHCLRNRTLYDAEKAFPERLTLAA